MLMFKANPAKYEELGQFDAGVVECSSPTIAGGKLFVRAIDGIACYDLMGK
jgi:hypothetical protein